MKEPQMTAYSIRKYMQGGEEKKQWLKVGSAWPHTDGDGWDVVLQALPLDGRVILRKLRKHDGDTTGSET